MSHAKTTCRCKLCNAVITQDEADEAAAIRQHEETLCVRCAVSLNEADAAE